MPNKYNPFRPDKMAPPGLFAGRISEIQAIDHCLLQAKSGNPQHFLIQGERGIGKSSLFWLEQWVASGDIPTLETEQTLNFIVVSVSLQEQDDYIAIIRKIAAALKKELAKREKLKSQALSVWDFITRFEAVGIRYNREKVRVEESEALSCLQADIVGILSNLHDIDGILLLIDEADKPSPDAGLGLICKLLTEEITRNNCEHLCIGLAGLPGILQKLKDSHESSPRIFKTMDLQPLEKSERESVIKRGLKQAEEKNGFAVSVTEDGLELLCSLSEGYPHFLQEFAYAAYEEDEDCVIDTLDVRNSLFKENGPFEQLGRKFFLQFYSAPSSDDYRTILHFMADEFDSWVDRATIIERSGLKSATVDNALRALKSKSIILQDDTRRGYYRLPTRAFAVWIKAQQEAKEVAENTLDGKGLFSK